VDGSQLEVITMNCPKCQAPVRETSGSPVSPHINTYHCDSCSWHGLRCGDTSCHGYLEPEEMGYGSTVRYSCVTCGWTGTGARVLVA